MIQTVVKHLYNHLFFFVFLIWIVSFTSCNFSESSEEQKSSTTYASLVDSTKYVGMLTCKQCHLKIYESYVETGMGQSFDLASREKTSAHFDSHSLVTDSFLSYYYHPHWKGDSLNVLEYRLSGRDTTYKRIEQIKYIIGSGQHTNSHIRSINDYLYQVPVTYYTQKGKWDLPPGFEGGFNSRFNRKIELECMSCHNGFPELVPGSENKYLKVPNGIDCERCHGPGAKHVADKTSGNFIDTSKYIDYSIVNPSKLPIDLQMDVCQRCHIQGNAVLKEGKSFNDFRPGMSLASFMNVFMPVYEGDPDAHIMASHVERLKMSKCFLVSAERSHTKSEVNQLKPYKDALTCISCHNPHLSVRKTDMDVFNSACISCHGGTENRSGMKQAKQSTCSELETKRMEFKNNCVSCHMPKNGSIDIPHVVTTDHFIRKPVSKKELEGIREFIGLACINEAVVDSITRAKAFLSYYEKFSSNIAFLDSAKRFISDRRPEDRRTNFKQLIHWAYLKESYVDVVKYAKEVREENAFVGKFSADNSDAWTAYRIGESYYKLSDLKNALSYYQKSVELAPLKPDFRNKLASTQQDLGQIEASARNYKFLLEENPDFVPAYTNYGYLLLKEFGDIKGSEKMYKVALSLDPLNEQAQLNLIGLRIYEGRMDEVRQLLSAFLKVYPTNPIALDLKTKIGRQ